MQQMVKNTKPEREKARSLVLGSMIKTCGYVEIQELRGLFSTYRLYRKQTTQYKNRIHSLLKEKLYGFTQEELFTQKSRATIRRIENGSALSFQIQELLDMLDFYHRRLRLRETLT
jgi:hypothetical protein